ncbi:MAG: hypothetical protein HY291_16940 [Planctomycetes bacterium]|nr:hypothetical protein [Planctomycetota bacterium]
MKWFSAFLIVATYVAHQDYWNWKETHPLVFGFLPVGLAYHAAYCGVASLLLAFLVKTVWPVELERVEPLNPDTGQGAH